MPDPAPVPLVWQPLRQKQSHPAAPQQFAPRQSPRIPRDPVPAGPDPDTPILIDLLKLNRVSIIFTPDVLAGKVFVIHLTH